MQSHHVPNIVWGILLVVAGLLFVFRPASPALQKTTFTLPDGFVVTADIAETPEEKAQGLGGRSRLGPAEGMYFPFEEAEVRSFWMKDMRFPIDIVWLREGIVVGVEPSVPPPESPEDAPRSYSSLVPVDAVLELSAGESAVHGLLPGTELREVLP